LAVHDKGAYILVHIERSISLFGTRKTDNLGCVSSSISYR